MGMKRRKRMRKKRQISRQTVVSAARLLFVFFLLAISVFSAVVWEQYVLSAVLLGVALVTFGLYFR